MVTIDKISAQTVKAVGSIKPDILQVDISSEGIVQLSTTNEVCSLRATLKSQGKGKVNKELRIITGINSLKSIEKIKQNRFEINIKENKLSFSSDVFSFSHGSV